MRRSSLRQINMSVQRPTYSEFLFPWEKEMLRAVICKGDPTSHGGTVLEGNELVTTNGRAVAHIGHMTFCPQCKGNYPISEGLARHTYAGRGTALDGMKTACGAKLIATQQQMVVDDGGSDDGQCNDRQGEAQGAVTGGQQGQYSGAFRAVDERTGQPVSGRPYRIELADGSVIRGKTGQDGNTQRVTSSHPDTVKLYWETESYDE
ncbi:PAAR domain-containing protein [Duganella sp. CY15W]|uniref:PAAR domain-containing protein n=1 Tax=Duganella sp. CY15W TaxID=2692172 RepID=UPI001371EB1D|nr:PAAR domain-containing protein [Duganella sp. CY15W]MYM29477.1 PAAR domain-containing protein [Duganella sp. CY15W]